VNSEELEQSLRTEFESYLKEVFAGVRQEVSEFQKKIEAEFEKHKSQIDDSFQAFNNRFTEDMAIDEAFKESVVEHLRLARDEGARITATAIAEAEELEKEKAVVEDSSVVVADIRNAIQDISSKTTQSAILKSLVNNAAKFTPRGAFFIIKNEHLVGWRVFGNEGNADDKTVREVFFPVSNETILGEAVGKLETIEGNFGTFADDSIFLNRLQFGQPDRMYAIPLVVRERAVAVLYADYGNQGSNVNVEALETLVQVASLTVELSASARSVKAPVDSAAVEETSQVQDEIEETSQVQGEVEETVEETTESTSAFEETAEPVAEFSPVNQFEQSDYSDFEQPVEETSSTVGVQESVEETYSVPQYEESVESRNFEFKPSVQAEEFQVETEEYQEDFSVREEVDEEEASFEQDDFASIETEEKPFETEPAWSQTTSNEDYYSYESKPSFETTDYSSFETPAVEEKVVTEDVFSAPVVNEYEFESSQSLETSTGFEVEDYSSTNGQTYTAVETEPVKVESPVTEVPVVETVSTQPARSRLSDRNVDLPIEVSEDERRLHNDARRFARLLVSEIKLYNEQKVKEGRESSDLYERLREAIDRSREMYDKRVQPPVATKFDYFHYELVSNLAEGDENKLGNSYPGTNV
jgi:hypothetical protein